MVAIEYKPGERNRTGRTRALPAGAVHHRQPLAKNVDTLEPAGFEDCAAPLALEERQAQQHVHARAEQQRVAHELIGELERWISDDRADVIGRRTVLHQEVDSGLVLIRRAVVDQISRPNLMAMGAQDANNSARSARRLPYCAGWNRLDREQRAHRLRRRLIEIVRAIDQRIAAWIGGVGEYHG